MKERKDIDAPRSSGAGARPSSLDPGKSTLTSQLPVAPSTRDVDRPAPHDERPAAPVGGQAPGTHQALDAPPDQISVYPIDLHPKSVAGEQIIFGALYSHANPSSFRLIYSSVGGHFGAQGAGTTTKTIAGLEAANVDWFIDAAWNGTSPVTMKLEVQKSDGTVVATERWAFSKKTYHPTTIKQHEGEEERDIPARYLYQLGPRRPAGQGDYTGFTILERFSPNRSNLTVADIKPTYSRARGLDSDAKVTAHFFGEPSNHGTFTVSGDIMADVHKNLVGLEEAKAQLAAPKQVEKSVDQTYESDPGTALGRYRITRILKPDGSAKIAKKKL